MEPTTATTVPPRARLVRGWRHAEMARVIHFGPDAVQHTLDELGEGYTLLSTPRAVGQRPDVALRAAHSFDVPQGPVDEVAESLREKVVGEQLVGFGGGRVIDVAKALAALEPGRSVTAIPTTLAGAEMTASHRQATNAPSNAGQVRPSRIAVDPELSASQPPLELAASAANAYAHALEALVGTGGSPITDTVATRACGAIAHAFSATAVCRDDLALGGLLAGWAIDHTGVGLHHVLAQSVVRVTQLAHGAVNAALLPYTAGALTGRADVDLREMLGHDPVELAEQLRYRSTARRGLYALGATDEQLDASAALAATRAQLANTPPGADLSELRALLTQAG